MSDPVIAQKKPYLVELKAGRHYLWCRCGRSAKQPYCDGSHAGTAFTPLRFDAKQGGEAVLCGCKQTRTPPFCDGTHNKLSERYQEATADELSAAASLPLARRDRDSWGKATLTVSLYTRKLSQFKGAARRRKLIIRWRKGQFRD